MQNKEIVLSFFVEGGNIQIIKTTIENKTVFELQTNENTDDFTSSSKNKFGTFVSAFKSLNEKYEWYYWHLESVAIRYQEIIRIKLVEHSQKPTFDKDWFNHTKSRFEEVLGCEIKFDALKNNNSIQNVFQSSEEIEILFKKADVKLSYTKTVIPLIELVAQLKKERKEFYLDFDEVGDIFKWRYNEYWTDVLQPEMKENCNVSNVEIIIKAVFSVNHSNKEIETKLRLNLLLIISEMSVSRASVILFIFEPHKYAILHSEIWKALYNTKKDNLSINDYITYLSDIKELSQHFDVSISEICLALWGKNI